MSAPLLQTKLYVPPPRPSQVPRPRLVERLEEGRRMGCGLTLISAPAGFGKTTLLSEWIAGSKPRMRVAWLSLDPHDNDPARFWSYLIAATQTAFPGLGVAVLEALQAPQPPPIEALLTDLINEIAETSTPFTLILDDFHVITAPQINDALLLLLDSPPPLLHLVISSRANPPWPLARMRARRQMAELDADDLRFTPAQVSAFLNEVMGLALSPEDVTALDARTEGWVAGLQMAALSMQQREDKTAFIKAFTGSHRFVLDYLVEEVLDRQPDDVQEFLLKTSILERMTAPLCDAITDRNDSQSILTQLEQSNVFLVPLDDERRWYRYHHLFADLLRQRLSAAHPDRLPVLHRRASEWYEGQHLTVEAVHHAMAAGDVQRAANLVERYAREMIFISEHATLLHWLEALPVQVVRTRPWLCIYLAWSRLWIGPTDQVQVWLQAAEKALEGTPAHATPEAASGSVLNLTEDERRHIAGNVSALRAYEAHFDGHFERAVQMAQQAISLLPAKDTISGSSMLVLGDAYLSLGDLQLAVHAYRETKRIALHNRNYSLTVMAVCRVAEALMKQARLYEAFGVFQEAIQLATHPSGRQLLSAGYPKIQMSLLLCEWNRLEEASACLKDGMEQCAKWGPVDMRMGSTISLVDLQLAQGNTEGALNALQKLQALLQEEAASPGVVSTVDSLRLRLWLARNDVDAATRWVEDNRAKFEGQLSRRCLSDHINLARVLHAQGVRDPSGPYLEQALQRLALLLEEAEAAGWNHDVICILVRQALVLHARGDAQGALALARALHLAEPGGYIRTFIGEGEPIGRLLRQVAARSIEPAYVGRLLAALEPESGRRVRLTPAQLIEPLSERESEVLRLLRTDLSSTGIAQVLHISVNTVRSHQKNIYGKLNAHSRFDAITRAEELGLL